MPASSVGRLNTGWLLHDIQVQTPRIYKAFHLDRQSRLGYLSRPPLSSSSTAHGSPAISSSFSSTGAEPVAVSSSVESPSENCTSRSPPLCCVGSEFLLEVGAVFPCPSALIDGAVEEAALAARHSRSDC